LFFSQPQGPCSPPGPSLSHSSSILLPRLTRHEERHRLVERELGAALIALKLALELEVDRQHIAGLSSRRRTRPADTATLSRPRTFARPSAAHRPRHPVLQRSLDVVEVFFLVRGPERVDRVVRVAGLHPIRAKRGHLRVSLFGILAASSASSLGGIAWISGRLASLIQSWS
jgi:hypothetical protein